LCKNNTFSQTNKKTTDKKLYHLKAVRYFCASTGFFLEKVKKKRVFYGNRCWLGGFLSVFWRVLFDFLCGYMWNANYANYADEYLDNLELARKKSVNHDLLI